MEFTGRYVIPATPEAVWAGLNDPAVLKASIPGCQSMDKTDDNTFSAVATVKVGPVRATFRGKVTMENAVAPSNLTLKGEGQGGVAGFAKGEADVTLTPEDGGTALSYTARANVGGKLAQIGQRLIDGAAKQMADDFFSRFSAQIAPQVEETEEQREEDAEAMATPESVAAHATPETQMRRDGLAPEIWVVGLIAVIVILLVLFGVVL